MSSRYGVDSCPLIFQITGLHKRCFKYCLKMNTLEDLIESANCKLVHTAPTLCYLQYLAVSHKLLNSGDIIECNIPHPKLFYGTT